MTGGVREKKWKTDGKRQQGVALSEAEIKRQETEILRFK